MKRKSVKVIRESSSGRNETFKDTVTNRYMNTEQFVKSIEKGAYEGYHIREINGIKTPCSNPDNSSNNNLG